ncbi:peptidoglycan-binding protein [Plectonema radiosum NIES-515]|uniref:Peptidoglycan-binding protein n=1 Tax=Plectonema radiosum NIES-515 TaxID=2986073 RepID=A0ABT3AUY1_9CYAN|nr:peptidoglycan-binding protein [Plectonema radiosum]MCV3212939.1 peptidoglycan-binding protein [Plectonema radiosum NIES-515]
MVRVIPCFLHRPTLELGASREEVKQMQKVLNQRLSEFDTASSFPQNVAETGYFNQNTLIAVKYLQCLTFLPVDGIVGPKTWAFLSEGPGSLPRLRVGTASSVVKAVQEALRYAGYYSGAVDGVFQQKTAAAVKDFQVSCQMTADGVINPQTWKGLIKLDAHGKYCYINLIDRCYEKYEHWDGSFSYVNWHN